MRFTDDRWNTKRRVGNAQVSNKPCRRMHAIKRVGSRKALTGRTRRLLCATPRDLRGRVREGFVGGWKISNGDKLHSRHAPLLRGEHPRAPRQMPLSSHLPHGFCIPSKPELSAANLSSFFPPEFSKQRDDDFPPSLYIYVSFSRAIIRD